MGWNYRVVKQVTRGEESYTIHETYSGKGEKAEFITAYSTEPIYPLGGTLDELRSDLQMMLKALDKPVLEADKIIGEPMVRDEE